MFHINLTIYGFSLEFTTSQSKKQILSTCFIFLVSFWTEKNEKLCRQIPTWIHCEDHNLPFFCKIVIGNCIMSIPSGACSRSPESKSFIIISWNIFWCRITRPSIHNRNSVWRSKFDCQMICKSIETKSSNTTAYWSMNTKILPYHMIGPIFLCISKIF